jgi:hypothetical protein
MFGPHRFLKDGQCCFTDTFCLPGLPPTVVQKRKLSYGGIFREFALSLLSSNRNLVKEGFSDV